MSYWFYFIACSSTCSANELGGLEHTDVEDIHSLQFMQWTTPQYCVAVLEKLLPCLKTTDEMFLLRSTELLHQLIGLLHESVESQVLWDDSSVPARELVWCRTLVIVLWTLYVHVTMTYCFMDFLVVTFVHFSLFLVICRLLLSYFNFKIWKQIE